MPYLPKRKKRIQILDNLATVLFYNLATVHLDLFPLWLPLGAGEGTPRVGPNEFFWTN